MLAAADNRPKIALGLTIKLELLVKANFEILIEAEDDADLS
jgi:hypothetical protein